MKQISTWRQGWSLSRRGYCVCIVSADTAVGFATNPIFPPRQVLISDDGWTTQVGRSSSDKIKFFNFVPWDFFWVGNEASDE